MPIYAVPVLKSMQKACPFTHEKHLGAFRQNYGHLFVSTFSNCMRNKSLEDPAHIIWNEFFRWLGPLYVRETHAPCFSTVTGRKTLPAFPPRWLHEVST